MNTPSQTNCINCGVSLNAEDGKPCYNCAEKEKTILVNFIEEVAMKENIRLDSISGNTNRQTIHSDSLNPTDTLRIHELIIKFVESDVDDLTSFIDALVKGFKTPLKTKFLTFYRGVDESVEKHLCTKQIGPSPNTNDGRYNVSGESCIYLIDEKDFLFEEVLSPSGGGSTSILIQQYNIPVGSFKIADLSTNNIHLNNSIALAFDMTESGKTSIGYNFEEELENRGRSKYLVSQLLSFSFKRNGWDGIYVPGVHGSNGRHYNNCTLFGTIVDQCGRCQGSCRNYHPKLSSTFPRVLVI